MLREKTMRGRRIARSILLTLIPAAVAVGLGQTQSRGSAEGQSPSAQKITGNPVAGRAIFEGVGNCLSCHRAGAAGAVLAPNLSDVGAEYSPDELKQKLLTPSPALDPKNRLYQIVTDRGKTIRGKLLNQGPLSLQMLASDGRLIALPRAQIRGGHFVDPPQMPSYQSKLTSTQIDDLVAYLASMRTPGGQ